MPININKPKNFFISIKLAVFYFLSRANFEASSEVAIRLTVYCNQYTSNRTINYAMLLA